MWKRKELKSKAKKVVRKNYWTAIVVCFLIALLTGEFGTSIIGLFQEDDSINPYYIITHTNEFFDEKEDEDKSEAMKEQTEIAKLIEEKKGSLSETEKKVLNIIEANLNSITKSKKYIFKVSDAIKSFIFERNDIAIELIIMAVISFAFAIFIANPLIVAGKRYFIKARKKSSAKIGVILEVFSKKCWLNVSIIIFLRDIYNLLWYLTIVMGIIKTYEYKMISYILADNPEIGRKEAFKLSKQMMKGNKWRVFVLDLSFIGWEILSMFTLGLLNIFYINPYKVATKVELYEILKKEGIKEKYDYYEKLEKIN